MGKKSKIEGFWDIKPQIKKIDFNVRGKFSVYLTDGRIIIVPIAMFPSIKKLDAEKRRKWFIFGNGFSFDDCDEVFHIEQLLGNFNSYKHEA